MPGQESWVEAASAPEKRWWKPAERGEKGGKKTRFEIAMGTNPCGAPCKMSTKDQGHLRRMLAREQRGHRVRGKGKDREEKEKIGKGTLRLFLSLSQVNLLTRVRPT